MAPGISLEQDSENRNGQLLFYFAQKPFHFEFHRNRSCPPPALFIIDMRLLGDVVRNSMAITLITPCSLCHFPHR